MELKVVRVGNAKGFRLSKTVLEKYNIKDKVDMILEEDQIILRPIDEPRKGWDEIFEMLGSDTEGLLIPDVFEDENFEQWN
jgi:antitoxin MazE